ncbi:MAG: ATP-binding cassette domain-containing protein [Fimbriimonadaceae bacterium]|nr:ATP-binding cassette domain-containing protein [Fimbriimonadaceae bacterium]
MKPHVKLTGITKRFGAVVALDDVSIEVEQGTIHAIVGENGAGKTTLMKVLYGAHTADSGSIEIDGQVKVFRNSAEAIAARIGMVSQHYSIIPELTCLQNLILGAEPGAWIDENAAVVRAEGLARQMGFEFDWSAEAGTLSPAGAQKLEILKLLWREADIMILDEPTAMLSPADGDALFASLTKLAAQGKTILLVTHRLPEVLQFCARVHVLRGGKNVASTEVPKDRPPVSTLLRPENVEHGELGGGGEGLGERSHGEPPTSERLRAGETPAVLFANQLAEWIVGHAMTESEISPFQGGTPFLEVSGLRVMGSRGDEALKGIDLTLRQGEVVGLAGVDGNGQRELFEALVGVGKVLSGDIRLGGTSINRLSPSDRISQGVRLIPEDRHEEGVIENWSLEDNGALGLQRASELRQGPLVDATARRSLAERIAERFRTKHGGLHQPMRSLSGGNQQRFVAARALELGPRLILAFQPTRGLDIDGTRSVYDAIRETCRTGQGGMGRQTPRHDEPHESESRAGGATPYAGATALIVSFDLDELLENCDRVIAINGGRIFEPRPGEEKDRAAIGRLMVGAEEAA